MLVRATKEPVDTGVEKKPKGTIVQIPAKQQICFRSCDAPCDRCDHLIRAAQSAQARSVTRELSQQRYKIARYREGTLERKKERKTPKRGFQGVGVLCTPHHKETRGVTADQKVEQDGVDELRD